MLKINGKKSYVSLLVIAVLVIPIFGVLVPMAHAQTPTASVIPAATNDPSIGPGSVIHINVTGTDFTDLFTWQVSVFYNPAVLNCTSMVIPAGLFKLDLGVTPIIDNVVGLAFGGSTEISSPSVSGSGVFATLTFTVVGRGTSEFSLGQPSSDTFFLNTAQNDISTTLNGGTFSNFVAPPTAKIYINPSSVVNPSLTEGQTFDVALSIQNGTGVHSWAADVFFNNTVLKAAEGIEGTYLSSAGSTAFNVTIQNDYSATFGLIHVNCVLATGGANGDGTLATLRFNVSATGSTALALDNLDLRDAQNALLPFTTADGFFSNVSIRDIAVEDVSTFNDVVAQGFMIGSTEIHITMNVTVKVVNNGDFNETFTVGIYVDSVLAAPLQTVENLTSHEERTLEFLWDTFGVSLGNHTLSASAEVLPGEANTENNTFVLGPIKVIFPGDVNQDGIVDMHDAFVLVQAFNAFYTDPVRYNHYADFNADGRIDMMDIGIWAVNFMRTPPS